MKIQTDEEKLEDYNKFFRFREEQVKILEEQVDKHWLEIKEKLKVYYAEPPNKKSVFDGIFHDMIEIEKYFKSLNRRKYWEDVVEEWINHHYKNK